MNHIDPSWSIYIDPKICGPNLYVSSQFCNLGGLRRNDRRTFGEFLPGGEPMLLGGAPNPSSPPAAERVQREGNCGFEMGVGCFNHIVLFFLLGVPVMFFSISPPKTNMEPENIPLEKEKHRPKPSIFVGSMLLGVYSSIMPANSQIIVCSLHGCILGAESCPPSRRLQSTFHVNPCCATRAPLNARIIYILIYLCI